MENLCSKLRQTEDENSKVHFDVNNVLSSFCLEMHKSAPPLGDCILFFREAHPWDHHAKERERERA